VELLAGGGATRVLVFRGLSAGEERALRALAGGGGTSDSLADMVLETGEAPTLSRWFFHLERMRLRGALRESLLHEGRALLHLDHIARGGWATLDTGTRDLPAHRSHESPPGGAAEAGAAPPRHEGRRVVLSRFAGLRRWGTDLVLESPLSGIRVTLADADATRLIHLLSAPRLLVELEGGIPAWSSRTARSAVEILLASGMVVETDENGVPEEDRWPPARRWEPEDLRFHAHSRLGHHDKPMGGTLPFTGQLEPLPALRPPRGTDITPLPPTDPSRIEAEDPTLFSAMEARRSRRPPFSRDLTLEELSTLLWRTARADPRRAWRDVPYEILSRPHPSGGGTYPLEWYVAHRSLDGLEEGIHHYLPARHALEGVPTEPEAVDALFASYRLLSEPDRAGSRDPVLIVLTARFGRANWKYRSVAYSLILKEVGVAIQSLYLVATAMGLGACALGAGDDVLFGRLVGLDPLEEAAVGEFLVGSYSGDGGEAAPPRA
jgi:oxazoline/thiazoline dehydrogenase